MTILVYGIIAVTIFVTLLTVAKMYSEKLRIELDDADAKIRIVFGSLVYSLCWMVSIPLTVMFFSGLLLLELVDILKFKLNLNTYCEKIDSLLSQDLRNFKNRHNDYEIREVIGSNFRYDLSHLPQKYKIESYNVTCNDANNPQIVIDSKEIRVDVSIGFKHGNMLRQYVLRNGEVEIIKFEKV